MNKKFLSALILASIYSINISVASTNYSYEPTRLEPVVNSQYMQQPLQYPRNNTLQGNVVMVPAGETTKAMLTSPLSSEYNSVGQTINLALTDDFYYGDCYGELLCRRK